MKVIHGIGAGTLLAGASAWSQNWPQDNIQNVANPQAIHQTCNTQGFTDRCVSESEFRINDYEWDGADSCNKIQWAWNGVCREPQGSPMQTDAWKYTPASNNDVNKADGHDYNQAIHFSLLFYEAQQSGLLPDWNRVPWRHHSNLQDGCAADPSQRRDMVGGWYDAGDMVKFNMPMASTGAVLAQGAVDFYEGYESAGEQQNMDNNLRFALDFFMKAYPEQNLFCGQVGDGYIDHALYARPEDMNDMCRPSWMCTAQSPCTEPAANMAAALALGSIYYAKRGDIAYAQQAYNKAVEIITYADTYRGYYTASIPQVVDFYGSWGIYDDLITGWSGMARAAQYHKDNGQVSIGSGDAEHFLEKGMSIYTTHLQYAGTSEFSWGDTTLQGVVNLAMLTNEDELWDALDKFVNDHVLYQPTTPGGLPWFSQWGSNRYASNAMFIGVMAVKAHDSTGASYRHGVNRDSVISKAKSTMTYILGDNPAYTSYLVGYDKFGTRNWPKQPHHKSSSCSKWGDFCSWNDFNNPGDNPHILYGAMVGGPGQNDEYSDRRDDYVHNEVTTDYNAGFQGTLAALKLLL